MDAVQSLYYLLMQQISVASGDVSVISKRLLLPEKDSSPRILSSVSVLIALVQLALKERLLI